MMDNENQTISYAIDHVVCGGAIVPHRDRVGTRRFAQH